MELLCPMSHTKTDAGYPTVEVQKPVASLGGGFVGQGIVAGSGTTFTGAAEYPNSNNTIQNNAIKGVANAAYISGEATTLDQNWLLTENEVGSTTVAEKLAYRGFYVGRAANVVIKIGRNRSRQA